MALFQGPDHLHMINVEVQFTMSFCVQASMKPVLRTPLVAVELLAKSEPSCLLCVLEKKHHDAVCIPFFFILSRSHLTY